METILSLLTLLLALVALVGSIVPIIPSLALSVVALLINYFSSTPVVTQRELFMWIGISVVVAVVDAILPIFITKRLGGSKSGMWGATLGLLFGFIAYPPFGVIIMPFIGAVMGELLNDKKDAAKAIKVGTASFLAFIVGTGLKFIVSLWILGILLGSLQETFMAFIDQIVAIFN